MSETSCQHLLVHDNKPQHFEALQQLLATEKRRRSHQKYDLVTRITILYDVMGRTGQKSTSAEAKFAKVFMGVSSF
ncbi:hypothetical protein Trydic_g13894 [Trypoxylus dichotomus]